MRFCRRRAQAPAQLPEGATEPVPGQPAQEQAEGGQRIAPDPQTVPVPAALGAAEPVRMAEQAATEENLCRATRPGEASRERFAGSRVLPWASTVSRRGVKTVFVVCRGSLAAGRPRAVIYGSWNEARHAVCTAAGNLDSGAVFHGFRTTAEARAYWLAAVGDIPWPLLVPATAEPRQAQRRAAAPARRRTRPWRPTTRVRMARASRRGWQRSSGLRRHRATAT